MHTKVDKESFSQKQLEAMMANLYRYCYHLTQNKWDGEEIAQETIYKAIKHYPHEKWNNALLKKVAYHQWVDTIRKRDREALFSEIDLQDEGITENDCCSEWLEKLLKHLTPKQYLTFILKEAFQYNISEIAVLLNMSDTGVKALLSRSRINISKLSHLGIDHGGSLENEKKILHVIANALHKQDPSELITLIPIVLDLPPKAIKTKYASPSCVLSLAA